MRPVRPYWPDPDVFFLPLAVAHPERFRLHDPWVLARRIPDFVHHLINESGPSPTAMLEVQTPYEPETPVQWVRFGAAPEAQDAFDLLPPDCDVRAVVTGTLELDHEGLAIEMVVHNREDLGDQISTRVRTSARMANPVGSICRLARHLARLLGVEFHEPEPILLTRSGPAFFRFLAGLDGSALLSGDLQIEVRDDAEILMRPYRESLGLDPQFGLALRSAQLTLFTALDEARIGTATCCDVLDGLLAKLPVDGDACVVVADHLSGLGEEGRAREWLEHACRLVPPPPKSLENLGILSANNGDLIRARHLWLDGLHLNGHPDFLAHLSRLSFSEGKLDDAWDQVIRGLRRIYERCVRASEWVEEGHELGLLLRYLVDHLHDHEPPAEVVEALLDLRSQLAVPEDRVDLGRCLARIGHADSAQEEIQGALGNDLDPEYRDEGIRLLLNLQVPDFERRFAAASDQVMAGGDPGPALAEVLLFLDEQPEFWPGLFLEAIGQKRLGDEDAALDRLADVLRICPGQPDALFEMAELFAARGNPKRALECVEEAVDGSSDEAPLYAAMARYLRALGRLDEARTAARNALDVAPDDPDIRRLAADLGVGGS